MPNSAGERKTEAIILAIPRVRYLEEPAGSAAVAPCVLSLLLCILWVHGGVLLSFPLSRPWIPAAGDPIQPL